MQLSHPMDPSGAWHRMAIHSNNCQTGDADDACETIDLPVLSVCSVWFAMQAPAAHDLHLASNLANHTHQRRYVNHRSSSHNIAHLKCFHAPNSTCTHHHIRKTHEWMHCKLKTSFYGGAMQKGTSKIKACQIFALLWLCFDSWCSRHGMAEQLRSWLRLSRSLEPCATCAIMCNSNMSIPFKCQEPACGVLGTDPASDLQVRSCDSFAGHLLFCLFEVCHATVRSHVSRFFFSSRHSKLRDISKK